MRYVKKILLTGGGTGGSVSPLLAIVEELRAQSEPGAYEFLWLGTRGGIEAEMVTRTNIPFRPIHAGKLRRYFDWRNFIDPFLVLIGFFESLAIIYKWKPDLIISAGAFSSVPVVWAGALCRAPIIIHQQDARPGLANRLAAPFARLITVTFEKSLADFGPKAVWTGNPIRRNFQFPTLPTGRQVSNFQFKDEINFSNNQPVVLIMGGGAGAQFINDLVAGSLDELAKFCNVIHLTGKNKTSAVKCPARHASPGDAGGQMSNVRCYEFLNVDEMAEVFSQADLVVTRAGMATLTELSYLGKPAIIIPIPESHQEDNARIFAEAQAAIVLGQNELSEEYFLKTVKKIIADKQALENLSANIKKVIKAEANREIVKFIKSFFA